MRQRPPAHQSVSKLIHGPVAVRQNTIEDTLDLLHALIGAMFPPGELVGVRFDRVPAAAISTADVACTVVNASDRSGNDVPNPESIPCAVSAPTLP